VIQPGPDVYFQKLNNTGWWRKLLVIAVMGLLTACSQTGATAPSARIQLSGPWFQAAGQPGDGPQDAVDLPFTSLSTVELQDLVHLVPGGHGIVWLKTSFTIPESLRDKQLGLFLGRVTMADQTWLNGSLIGAEGGFPPRLWSAWNVFRNYSVPSGLLYVNQENSLLIKIYVGGEGSLTEKPFLAEKQNTDQQYWTKLFTNVVVNLLAASLMLVFGLYHVLLFARRPKEKESLSFALLAILGALYLSNFYASYLPWFRINPPDFLLFQKIVASMSLYVIAFLFAAFVRDFLGRKESRTVGLIRLALLLLPLLIILLLPDYTRLRAWRGPITVIFLLPVVLYSLYMVIDSLRHGNKDAFALLTGVSPLFVTVLLDIILHNILRLDELPYFLGFGFPLMIMSLLFILAGRFATARNQAESLNINLEGLVRDRTSALTTANDTLSTTLGQLETQVGIYQTTVTELEQLRTRLQYLSDNDELTGLPNRRCFGRYYQDFWKTAANQNNILAVLFIDIDFFKQYNDFYGHLKGDESLQTVGGCLSAHQDLRSFFARFGGEEFIGLLLCDDPDCISTVAEKILEEVTQLKIPHEKSGISPWLTISIGISWSRPAPGKESRALIDAADKCLYQAKDTGRNRIVLRQLELVAEC